MTGLRAVVAEDQLLLRSGIVRILDGNGITVVEAVSTGPEAEDAVRQHRPDVVILDVRMPPSGTSEGLRVAGRVRAEIPGLPVLVLSHHVDLTYVRELLADGAGGFGYLLKDRVVDADDFVGAVCRVARGEIVTDPYVMAGLVAAPERHEPFADLTEREKRVLKLMAEGCTNAEIGRRLSVTERTVGKCVHGVSAKLRIDRDPGVDRRVSAVLIYLRHHTLKA